MQKYEPDVEQMNNEYRKLKNKDLSTSVPDIVELFIKAIDAAYERGLNGEKLERETYIFSVKEAKS